MRCYALFTALIVSCVSLNTFAIRPAADVEVQKLLRFVGHSGCSFIRSGNTTYTAQQAQEHLTMKYGKARDKISTAEDFINEVGSKSYLTGQAYQIQCPKLAQQPAAAWLHAELKRQRNTQ